MGYQVLQMHLSCAAAAAVGCAVKSHGEGLQRDGLGQVGDGSTHRQQGQHLWGEIPQGDAAQGDLQQFRRQVAWVQPVTGQVRWSVGF